MLLCYLFCSLWWIGWIGAVGGGAAAVGTELDVAGVVVGARLLGCWVVGLLGCWVVGLLGCWFVGL